MAPTRRGLCQRADPAGPDGQPSGAGGGGCRTTHGRRRTVRGPARGRAAAALLGGV